MAIGDIDLEKFPDNGGSLDSASFYFANVKLQPGIGPFLASYQAYFTTHFDPLPLGTCIVYSRLSPNNNDFSAALTFLDGGSSITLKGPSGTVNAQGGNGNGVTIDAGGKFLVPGAVTVSGAGGKDVGAFNATITIPQLPTLTSPPATPAPTVTRANGMTLTWTGGDPSGALDITLAASVDNTFFGNGATAQCKAPATAGTFAIPPYILLALPAGGAANLAVSSGETDVPFTATGIDAGVLHTQSAVTSFTVVLK